MGWRLITKHWFRYLIAAYIVLGIYVLSIVYNNPYLSIALKEVNEHYVLDEASYAKESYENWLNKHGVSKGDMVDSIDHIPIQHISSIHYIKKILSAKQLTIQKSNGEYTDIIINHFDFTHQFYMLFIFPCIYFLVALGVALYLYSRKRHISYINFLIIFMLSVSIAYISTGASSGGNLLGMIINSGFMLLSLVILLHFIKNYFSYLRIDWPFLDYVKLLYVLPFSATIIRIIRVIFPRFSLVDSIFILVIFLILLLTLLYVLISIFLKSRLPQVKLIFIGLLIPFLPFLCLFALPKILFKYTILNADICALFLLLIPFNIIFLQLTERLFDLDYHITRFRYYFLMALFFTCWLVVGIYFMSNLSLTKLVWNALFMFVSIFVFFFIKEKVDYRGRKILFSTKGNHIHKLYQTIQKLGTSYHVDQILQMLTEEVSKYLEVEEVTVVTYEFSTGHLQFTKNKIPVLELSKIETLALGNIIKIENLYIAFIHQDAKYKRWLVIDSHRSIRLKAEELLWLELLLIYTNTLIESMKIIEELIDELKQQQRLNTTEPIWLKKLIWMKVEEEKFQFAQELHDTFLQEHLHIARQIDLLTLEKNPTVAQVSLEILHEQFIHSIDNLRMYCETLKPTLLTNIGLHAALERLAERTEERSTFMLITSFDRLYLEDEQLTLMIYRIIQELLNNAMKHSQATNVELSLQECENGFVIIYNDDGVGFNTKTIQHSESLGIQGIREKTEAFNGHILIESEPNKGMYMQITIYEGSDELDFSFNNR